MLVRIATALLALVLLATLLVPVSAPRKLHSYPVATVGDLKQQFGKCIKSLESAHYGIPLERWSKHSQDNWRGFHASLEALKYCPDDAPAVETLLQLRNHNEGLSDETDLVP